MHFSLCQPHRHSVKLPVFTDTELCFHVWIVAKPICLMFFLFFKLKFTLSHLHTQKSEIINLLWSLYGLLCSEPLNSVKDYGCFLLKQCTLYSCSVDKFHRWLLGDQCTSTYSIAQVTEFVKRWICVQGVRCRGPLLKIPRRCSEPVHEEWPK